MLRLIDHCATAEPHADWDRFRNLPYDDLICLHAWLEKAFRNDPPDDRLKGLWFGLFNPIYEAEPASDIYICGSNSFTHDDNTWAQSAVWHPKEAYAHSPVLESIYRLAYERDDGLGNEAEYPLCLGYGAMAVQALLRESTSGRLIIEQARVGVAVGFDDGDWIGLGFWTPCGLTPPESTTQD